MRILARTLLMALALGVLGTVPAEAQERTIGFKLGPSFSKMSFDEDDVGQKWLTKFTGGGFLSLDMGAFRLQPELTYVTKGGKWDGAGESGEWSFDYVEVPVLFVLPMGHGAGIRPSLYAGPAIAYQVGCSVSFGGLSIDCDSDDQTKLDIGAMLGGGLAFPAGPGSLLVEGRFTFGLRNLADDGTLRHRTGALLVGYSATLRP
jgi:hypothetical protein